MPTPTVCPRCSTPFDCGIDTGSCWCREVSLGHPARAAFAEFYDGCLCRGCLTEMADRPAAPSVREFLTARVKLMLKRG